MKNNKILIVDDQQCNLSVLRTQLIEYEVIEADNGRTALKMIFQEKPDLILMNLMLPGVDGYSLLSILKNSEETQMIPVILITSSVSPDEKIKALEKGADDLLIKPFNPLELKARVKSLLRIKSLQDELDNLFELVIKLAGGMESKVHYWVNHSRRTAFYAEKLAHKFVPLKSTHQLIKTAGYLHDIGKMFIPNDILTKAELTPEEFEIVKSHTVIGAEVCSTISKFQLILPYIKHHHERFDGNGYPDGLKGTDIPLGARILSVADGFDALTNDRPHRKALNSEQALNIMIDHAGSQWDPVIVNYLSEILSDDSVLMEQLVWKIEEKNNQNISLD